MMVTLHSYTKCVGPEMLLSCEPLATHGTREGPLSGVAADVSLHDSFLLGSVWTERALVEFYWNYQAIACRGRKTTTEYIKTFCFRIYCI